MRILTVSLALVTLGGIFPWEMTKAQEGGIMSVIESILQKIEELSAQVKDLSESFTAQTQQIAELKQQLERLQSLAEQLEPLLNRWPEVEGALSQIASLQSKLGSLQSALNELKRRVGSGTSTSRDPRVDALQAQLNDLERKLTERDEAIASLQGELKAAKAVNWGTLGAVVLLLLWQLGQLLAGRSRAVGPH